MTDNLYRVWEIAHGTEIPVNVKPIDFASARLTMRLRSIEVCNNLGWSMDSQGVDFVIYNIPQGQIYELRIRMETPEYVAYETVSGRRYTVDEGIENVDPREPAFRLPIEPMPMEWHEAETQHDIPVEYVDERDGGDDSREQEAGVA